MKYVHDVEHFCGNDILAAASACRRFRPCDKDVIPTGQEGTWSELSCLHGGIEEGRIFTVFHYNNRREKMERIEKPVARFAISTTSIFLIGFLVIVKPCEAILCRGAGNAYLLRVNME